MSISLCADSVVNVLGTLYVHHKRLNIVCYLAFLGLNLICPTSPLPVGFFVSSVAAGSLGDEIELDEKSERQIWTFLKN